MAYSEDQISEALTLLTANEGNVAQTRRQLEGLWGSAPARRTIKRWQERAEEPTTERDKAVGKSAQEKKESLADRVEVIAWKIAEELENEDKITEARLTQLTTAFGTLVDKMRLLREESTAIEEQRHSQVIKIGDNEIAF